jgi:hypothetical protein
MNNLFGFVEVVAAILGAMVLAMCLEWLTLNGLTRVMPPPLAPRKNGGEVHDSQLPPKRLASNAKLGAKKSSGLTLFSR